MLKLAGGARVGDGVRVLRWFVGVVGMEGSSASALAGKARVPQSADSLGRANAVRLFNLGMNSVTANYIAAVF
jgi:hypothetical protein